MNNQKLKEKIHKLQRELKNSSFLAKAPKQVVDNKKAQLEHFIRHDQSVGRIIEIDYGWLKIKLKVLKPSTPVLKVNRNNILEVQVLEQKFRTH